MFISDLSIRRPVFATVLNVILIVFGLFSLPRLAIDQYPNIDFPIVTVFVTYPGADPESVEQRVLKPLEESLNGLAGLKTMTSTAYPNIGQIVLQFNLEKDSDQASQEVRDKVFAAVSLLPDEADTPVVQKFDIGGAPIINIAVSGEGISTAQLSQIADDLIKPSLERVDGVARVTAAGIREREIHVLVDRRQLSTFGLTPSDVAATIGQQNLSLPGGKVQAKGAYWPIELDGRARTASDVAQLPLVGKGLTIGDIATTVDTIADEESAAFLNDMPTILLSIQKQSGSNTTSVAAGIKKEIAAMQKDLPKGISAKIVTDNSVYIEGSIGAVKLDLVVGAVLATLIVMIFLKDWRVTLISAVALPTAIAGTIAIIDYLGFTLNMMTTLGLTLSIGILIDDAIIVVENIFRHLQMGKSGEDAASAGTSEIGLAVLATTLTLCAVFIPVAFMEGIMGRFFYQFGLTVAISVLISLFVAFTLTPMLSAKFLNAEHHEIAIPGISHLLRYTDKALNVVEAAYTTTLNWCLNNRWKTIFGGVGVFVASIAMLAFIPVTFFPKEDRSEITINYTMPEGTAIDASKEKTLVLSRVLRSYPGVIEVVSSIGSSNDAKPNVARLDIKLSAPETRDFSQAQLMERLREDLMGTFGSNGSELVISDGGSSGPGGKPIQFVFVSDNWETLKAFSEKVEAFMKTTPGVVDVGTTLPKQQQNFRIIADKARAADIGITPAQMATSIRSLFEGEKVGEIIDQGMTYDIRMRISDADRMSSADIGGISLRSASGASVSLSSVAKIEEGVTASSVTRFGGQRQIGVNANFSGQDMNKAVSAISAFVSAEMPAGVRMSLTGQAEMMKDSIAAIGKALMLAVLLVYLILCAQYERYIAPLVIMSSLPLSLTGAFGALLITGQTMSIYTMIGIILLMGLVTKNGILLIDLTMQHMREGMSVTKALLAAGPVRLRPILMTTFAAGGGMLPVAIGHGVGGEAKSPMGVAVIGGLFVSTLLTLVVVPCLFSLVENGMERLKGRSKRRSAKEEVLVEAGQTV